VSARFHTPHWAILLSSATASAGIVANHLSGDFFLGVDLLVTAMLVNFLLMALSVLALPRRNPDIAREIRFMRSRRAQVTVAASAGALLLALTIIQIVKDVSADGAWYFHAFYTYLVVLAVASLIFAQRFHKMRREGVDLEARFRKLPEQ